MFILFKTPVYTGKSLTKILKYFWSNNSNSQLKKLAGLKIISYAANARIHIPGNCLTHFTVP